MENFNYADKSEQLKKINRFLSIGVMVFSVITGGIVLGSVLNQFRTVEYFTALAAILVVSNVLNMVLYKKNPYNAKIRYFALIELMLVGFLIVLEYDNDYMWFMNIIPLIGCILFFDVKFSAISGICVAVMDWMIVLCRIYVLQDFTGSDVINKLTSCLAMSVMLFIIWYTAHIGKKFNEDSLNKLKNEAEQQKKMVDDVIGIAEQVRSATINAMGFVDSLKDSAEIIRHSVGDISDSTTLTAENIQTQTMMTQNIQNNIEATVNRSADIVRVAEKSNELNSSNMVMIQELKNQTAVLAATNNQVAEAMNHLRSNVGNVKEITNTIFAISSQTNLLALNAAIESARAGEAGRGFAVVAEQIRELSEKTRKETENISAILEKLNSNADQTAEVVDKSVAVSNEQERMIGSVADQFDEMNGNVAELVGNIAEIDAMLESLATANNQIVDNIMQLSATTEEVTAAAQQSSDITERNYNDSVEAQALLHDVMEISHKMDKYISE